MWWIARRRMVFLIWFEACVMASTWLSIVMLSRMSFGSITCTILMPMFTAWMLLITWRWTWRFLMFIISTDHLRWFNFQWICIFIVATLIGSIVFRFDCVLFSVFLVQIVPKLFDLFIHWYCNREEKKRERKMEKERWLWQRKEQFRLIMLICFEDVWDFFLICFFFFAIFCLFGLNLFIFFLSSKLIS